MMVETAVGLMLMYNIAQNVNALKEEEEVRELQHLWELLTVEAVILLGLKMGIVMRSTIIQIVTMMVEIAVIVNGWQNVGASNEEEKFKHTCINSAQKE